jgi:hypothetical protein
MKGAIYKYNEGNWIQGQGSSSRKAVFTIDGYYISILNFRWLYRKTYNNIIHFIFVSD